MLFPSKILIDETLSTIFWRKKHSISSKVEMKAAIHDLGKISKDGFEISEWIGVFLKTLSTN